MAIGAFTFVLHGHLPYTRLPGQWPHGEEWIHEAASETYVPLLQTLYDLKEDVVEYKLTISISPALAEQLADPSIRDHFEQYLDNKIEAAQNDVHYFSEEAQTGDDPNTADPHLYYMAAWYRDWYTKIKTAFVKRFNRDLIGAFKTLQDEGYIEIITSAATHGYLPLLAPHSVEAQIKAGVTSYERMFGRAPTGIWLPECAYSPGLEAVLAQHGLKIFFAETHSITGGAPVGVAAGDVIGPYGRIKRRYVIPPTEQQSIPGRSATTFKAYTVSGGEADDSGVVVIGRNNRTGQQVWSMDWGYPGDFDYREFHKKSGTSGLQYWRVTGAKTDLAHKDYYHPEWAAYKIDQHAEHFAHLVGDLLRDYHNDSDEFGVIAANFNAALFGHWWFEGVNWLGRVLRHLAQNPDVELTTPATFLHEHPPQEHIDLPESSWGAGGLHFAWNNGETRWMWPPIRAAEQRMAELVARYAKPKKAEREVLNQAARELLLLQSSDWPLLITTGQAREYAIQRFTTHVDRFNALADSLDDDKPDAKLAAELYEIDRILPDIDYRWFAGETEA